MELVKVVDGNIAVAEEYLIGYANYLKTKTEWELKEKEFKRDLLVAMENNNIKSYENDVMKVTYVAPTTRTSVDTKRFKEECPDIYEAYTKTSKVNSCLKVSVK